MQVPQAVVKNSSRYVWKSFKDMGPVPAFAWVTEIIRWSCINRRSSSSLSNFAYSF